MFRREPTARPKPYVPQWVSLTKRYLAGDASAGSAAARAVSRWKRRHCPERKTAP